MKNQFLSRTEQYMLREEDQAQAMPTLVFVVEVVGLLLGPAAIVFSICLLFWG